MFGSRACIEVCGSLCRSLETSLRKLLLLTGYSEDGSRVGTEVRGYCRKNHRAAFHELPYYPFSSMISNVPWCFPEWLRGYKRRRILYTKCYYERHGGLIVIRKSSFTYQHARFRCGLSATSNQPARKRRRCAKWSENAPAEVGFVPMTRLL